MNFIYPQFLWGLLALGIPIIIHLFNLQRTRKVYFSNTAFLKNVQSISQRSIKIKNFLILLCRILFISFLVFAFSQPFISGRQKVQNTEIVNLYIDNSLSTQSNIGNERVLDVSVKGADALLKTLPSNASISLFSNELGNHKGENINKDKASELLSEVDFSPISRNFNEIINKRVGRRGTNISQFGKAVYIFSDFQKSTLGDLRKINIDSTINYFLIPVSPERLSNIYIDSVWLENPYININENNLLKARVINRGEKENDNILLKLSIDDRQVATSSINIGPNSNEIISFNFNVATKGIKKGVLSLTDFPVTFDNDYFFSFSTLDKIKILEINSGAGSQYIEKVYSNKELFDYTPKDISNLDYNIIQNFDLIVLNNIDEITEGFSESISKFLNTKGAIVLVPSEQTDVSSFNKFLSKYSIIAEKIESKDTVSVKELQQPDLNNPFYHGIFENAKDRIILPREKAIINWNNNGSSQLSFKDGRPFLTQLNTDNSKIFIFAGNLKNEKGLALNALFVPVMYKIALLSNASIERLSYSFKEQIISFPIKTTSKNGIYKLTKDSLEIIPNQRIAGKNLILEVPDIGLSPGQYDLKLGTETVKTVSFNYSDTESIMDFYSSEELNQILAQYKNIRILNSSSGRDLISEIETAKSEFPLWKICLIIGLFFLFLEILLIRFYKI